MSDTSKERNGRKSTCLAQKCLEAYMWAPHVTETLQEFFQCPFLKLLWVTAEALSDSLQLSDCGLPQ